MREYRFDDSRAKPDRFAAEMPAETIAVVLKPQTKGNAVASRISANRATPASYARPAAFADSCTSAVFTVFLSESKIKIEEVQTHWIS